MHSVIDGVMVIVLISLAMSVLTVRDLRRACWLFIAFGVLLSLIWLRLKSPELALAELLIGAGLTGTLLLQALERQRRALATDHTGTDTPR